MSAAAFSPSCSIPRASWPRSGASRSKSSSSWIAPAAWMAGPSNRPRPLFIAGCVFCNPRSEEHTSELQSPYDLVCRLLLAAPATYTLSLHDALPIFLTHRDERGGFFTLMLYPPSELAALRRQPLEIVFVLDCSGSMDGRPIEQAKAAVHRGLRLLQPEIGRAHV